MIIFGNLIRRYEGPKTLIHTLSSSENAMVYFKNTTLRRRKNNKIREQFWKLVTQAYLWDGPEPFPPVWSKSKRSTAEVIVRSGLKCPRKVAKNYRRAIKSILPILKIATRSYTSPPNERPAANYDRRQCSALL